MNYAKIVNGKLEYAPYEIYTEDGRVIELDTREKCLLNGYKEVIIYNKPIYDREKYDLIYKGFELNEEFDTISIRYELREKEIPSEILNELISIYNEEIND